MDKERVHAWWDFVVGNGVLTTTMVEEFAALVAEKEREACAAFLERGVDLAGLAGDQMLQAFTGKLLMVCAEAIRARGGETCVSPTEYRKGYASGFDFKPCPEGQSEAYRDGYRDGQAALADKWAAAL